MNEKALLEVLQHPDYQVLKRVPTIFLPRTSNEPKQFVATIIDLETMGLDATKDEIIEIGLLSFSFTNSDGILAITDTYNELNDPGRPISAEVTKVTGIRDDDVRGKAIDWDFVLQLLEKTDLIICHQSKFDRNFLELQTPSSVQSIIQSMFFACTINDIDWKERGFESSKLDYLNWKLGFFYDAHRAITDCWATFNILLQQDGAFDELKANVRKKETILCAANAPYEKKEILKARNYRWSDGVAHLPKAWWICLPNEMIADEKRWLDTEIYGREGASAKIPQSQVTAKNRYSFRAEMLQG